MMPPEPRIPPELRVAANEVGPVLMAGRIADAVVAVVRRQNAGARISPRGSYVRIAVAHRCEIEARAVAELLGEPFRIPQDLERVMTSFCGRLRLSEDRAVWETGR
ncbi:MAG TPA: MmoB/DmpM family protein [Polyangia bacterium]|nr:MmoB/DmpM family protein [Polyangia bacterium]